MSGQARMLDGYIVREQDRAAVQWRASCASDDALRRQIEVLSEGRLPSVHGVNSTDDASLACLLPKPPGKGGPHGGCG
jgi:hypothetical protein